MKTPLETLKAARLRLTPRKAWTKGWFAENKNGQPCNSSSPEACKWCAQGAINSVVPNDRLCQRTIDAIELAIGERLPIFNDAPRTTHKQVLAAFDEAIAQLEAK